MKSDIGMMAKGNLAPNGKKFPDPDVLLLSYTGCFTFMKWFELLREQYKCETIMLHTPYMGDGKITPNMTQYMVKQLKEEVIPKLERVSGVKFDIDRLRQYLKQSVKAENDLVWVLQSAKNKPSPIDAYFGGIYYIGPIFGAFRGTEDAVDYYKFLREEVAERVAAGLGPVTPDGDMGKEKYRLVVEGPPNYTASASSEDVLRRRRVVVTSSYTKVGGVTPGSRHDPDNPLETPPNASASTPTAVCRCASDARRLHRRVRSGRPADQPRSRAATASRPASPHDAEIRRHRQLAARRVRPGRSALFLRREQEPPGKLFPDDRAKRASARRLGEAG